jgi:hypothetical protein
VNIIAKYKSEIPDFDIDFETFVKELSTDETVLSIFDYPLIIAANYSIV